MHDDELAYVIHQSLPPLRGRRFQPLTVRAIINRLARIKTKKMSPEERDFLHEFLAAAENQGAFVEDSFLETAINTGKRVREEEYALDGEPRAWFGISSFFGLYVINWTQFGEGQENYGPYVTRKEAEAVFNSLVFLNKPR